LDIKIEKGHILLSGQVESVEENKNKKSKRISKVHFERSFSIPEGVDLKNPEFENGKGELLIKFKKLAPSKIKNQAPKKEQPSDERRPIGIDESDVTI
jgi:HSP20 family molecular chaperone IbpA